MASEMRNFSPCSIGSCLLPPMRASNKAHSVFRAKNKCQVIMCYIKLNYGICDVIIRERCWEAFTLRDGMQFCFYINFALLVHHPTAFQPAEQPFCVNKSFDHKTTKIFVHLNWDIKPTQNFYGEIQFRDAPCERVLKFISRTSFRESPLNALFIFRRLHDKYQFKFNTDELIT